MNEEKVLSIPANLTEGLIHRWLIYMCPDRPIYSAKFKGIQYVCFRHDINPHLGATDRIYQISKIIKIDFRNKTIKEALEGVDLDGRKLVDLITYIKQFGRDPELKAGITRGPMLMVFLKNVKDGKLSHLPRPERNGPFWTVYTWDELGKNDILPNKD